MRHRVKIFLAIILLFPLSTFAHGYWIELEGNHAINKPVIVKLIFGEYSLAEKLSGDKLDKMKDIQVFIILPGGKKQAIEMKQLPDCWQGTFTPASEGTYIITGINDQREVQDWTKHNLGITRPVQYLKAVYEVGKSSATTPSALLLDLSIKKSNTNGIEAVLQKNSKPLDTCLITVVSPSGDEEEQKTDKNGNASFAIKEKGLYIISVQWIDETPGVFKDKEYKTVRHRLDYSYYAR